MSGSPIFDATVSYLVNNQYAYSVIYKEEREELKEVRERNGKRATVDNDDFNFVMKLDQAVKLRLAKGQKAMLRGAGYNV